MGLGCADDVVVDDSGGNSGLGSIACSICLETVSDNGDRSWAKLQCGHQFHLDCIGSAFNVKGVMQCPNCRKIEKGQWLYANGSRSLPEFSMEDWTRDEDLYDLSYSEMSFGVHWCPFGSLTRVASSFEDGEFSSTAYHEQVGQHGIFAEQSHPCPYIAYFGPNASVSDGHWPSDSYPFPAMDMHYHRPTRSFMHPFGSSGSSVMIPPYPGSNADRVQAYYQQQPNNMTTPLVRRSTGHGGVNGGFYFFPPENPRYQAWPERDPTPIWGAFHQPPTAGFRQRR